MKEIASGVVLAVVVAALTFVGCTDETGITVCPDSSYCIDGVEVAPTIGVRSASVTSVDGRDFKDSNGNGELDRYEDWRLSPADRAADLVSRMTPSRTVTCASL